MNYSIIIYIIGMILKIEAVFMALPAITALIYQENFRCSFSDHDCFMPGHRASSHQEKADKKGFLHKRRFRDCSIKLDRSEYHRSNPLCDQPKHSKSCRCII